MGREMSFLILPEQPGYETLEPLPGEVWEKCRKSLQEGLWAALRDRTAFTFHFEHLRFLGSVLTDAMIKALSRSQLGWYAPFAHTDRNQIMVGTIAQKLLPVCGGGELVLFGFDVTPRDRDHFFLTIEIPPRVFVLLENAHDPFWERLTPFFAQGDCSFLEYKVPGVDLPKRRRGPNAFVRLMETVIAGRLSEDSDIGGSVEIKWPSDLAWDDLRTKMVTCLRCANEIYNLWVRHDSVQRS